MKPLKLSAFIAYRYLKTKKNIQAINIISYISMVAVVVLATSMVVLLSVFNGFQSLLDGLYDNFYPDIKVTATKGKWLTISDKQLQKIKQLDNIAYISQSAEDMALIITDDHQRVAVVKGVDKEWFKVNNFSECINGDYQNFDEIQAQNPVILGASIGGDLAINVYNPSTALSLYYPDANAPSVALEQSLNSINVQPIGTFSSQAEFDNRFIITPLKTAQSLFDNGKKYSSLEIKVNNKGNISSTIQQIRNIVTKNATVQNRYEQNKTINMVMKSEKLAIYVILTFILFIASFTLVGVMSMLAIDKKKDISVLKALGANAALIQNIFLLNGLLLTFIGAVIGIILGLAICVGQQHFGWVKLGDGFIVENYPVDIRLLDTIFVLIIILIVGLIAAWIPSLKAKAEALNFREE